MLVKRLRTVGLVVVILAFLGMAAGAAAAPAASTLAGPCAPGISYDPACDVDHDGDVDIFDIQLSAGHWGQSGTWMSDNDHNHLGQTWTGSNNPLKITGSFSNSPNRAPLILGNSSPFGSGLRVESAGADGVGLYSVGNDGVYVSSAGGDGIEVNSAGGEGLKVTSAGSDGVQIDSAGINGVYVFSADYAGVYVGTAGSDGVVVASASYNGVYANTIRASGEWGFYTDDKIHASNVALSGLTLVAQVTGTTSLAPGDVVAAAGLAAPLPDSHIPLPQVRLADRDASTSIVGVVEGRMALTAKPQHEDEQGSEPVLELRSAEGPAQPGDYVALTVLGVAQVKVQDGEAVQPGQRLTVADTPGTARALRTVQVEGVRVDESGPTLGVALEPATDGIVWVLVNPQ